MKPKLIAFEGPDCVGKSTQVEEVKQALRIKGLRVSSHKIPYVEDTITYEIISSLIRKNETFNYPFLFQGAMIDNRYAFQRDKINCSEEDVILVDRWNLSTLFYGEAQGISQKVSRNLLAKVLDPDAYIIFDGAPFSRESNDSLDSDMDLQRKVRYLYENHESDNSFHVEAQGSILEVTRRILLLLQTKVNLWS